MTDLTVALRLLADTAGAEGGLKKLAASLREMGAEQRRAGAEGDAAADRTADAWVQAAARIEAAATAAPDAMGQNAQAASGQMGNLVAQFNDIAMMLQAGQNPLQLAMQQGMQISQVIGPMGAAGAVRALGSAFLGMLSPINLVTIGGIAAGAALIQWLTSGTEKTLTLDEAMDDLEEAVAAYDKTAKSAAASTAEMRAQFGNGAEDARALLREIAAMEGKQAARALTTSFQTLDAGLGVSLREEAARGQRSAMGDSDWLNGLSAAQREQVRLRAELAQAFADMQDAMGIDDEGQRLIALADAAQRVKAAYEGGAEAAGGLTDENEAQLDTINRMVAAALRLKEVRDAEARAAALRAAQPNIDYGKSRAEGDRIMQESAGLGADLAREGRMSALIAQHGRDSLQVAVARVAAERELFRVKIESLNLGETETRQRMMQWEALKGIPALERDRQATAKALLADLQQQVTVQQAVGTYGEDSAEAARARTDAERAAFAALVDSLVPAGDLRDQLMAAWEQAEGLARTDMASGIAAARAEARAMADEIMRALGAAQALSAQGVTGLRESELRVKFAKDPVALAGALARDRMVAAQGVRRQGVEGGELAALDAEVNAYARNMEQIARNNEAQRAALAKGGGKGAGGRAGAGALTGLTGEAQKLLAELGIAQATVAEKVRAGLQSVAEGETEMANAKARTADRLANLIARLEALGPAGQAAAEQARAALQGLGSEAESVGAQVRASFIDSFEDNFARSLATGRDAMSAFADHVKMELARAFTQKFVTPLVSPLINGLMGLFGGLFPSAQGNVFQAGRAVPFAKGGVPDLAAHRDTVVHQPTVFPMAGGQAGVMGEAGPEAILPLLAGMAGLGVRALRPDGTADILPLRRAPGGALGVALPEAPDVGAVLRRPTFFASGGVVGRLSEAPRMGEAVGGIGASRPPAQIIINNNHPTAKVEATERQGSDGMSMDIVIEQIEGTLADRARRGVGSLSGVLGADFGLSRQGR